MIAIRSCRDTPLADLHELMCAAFADYVLPMRPTQDQFRLMLRQRGFDAAFSKIAIENDKAVAFWFIGYDPAIPTSGYVVASGTIPSHRRRGLAKQVFARVRGALLDKRVASLELEVIDGNHGARKLYQSLGFRPQRDVACYTIPMPTPMLTSSASIIIKDASLNDLREDGVNLWDWTPTWQNDFRSLARISDQLVSLECRKDGELVGYAILIGPTATLAQISIRTDQRRKGIGTHLLARLHRKFGRKAIQVINADARDICLAGFIEKHGGSLETKQTVMHLQV
ncbi:MAG: GNAT family N-acetyltransferase [Pseudomonadota bacterium]